jgi:hypothetical protein
MVKITFLRARRESFRQKVSLGVGRLGKERSTELPGSASCLPGLPLQSQYLQALKDHALSEAWLYSIRIGPSLAGLVWYQPCILLAE